MTRSTKPDSYICDCGERRPYGDPCLCFPADAEGPDEAQPVSSACNAWLARLEAVVDELESKPVNEGPEWGFERMAAARQLRDLISEAREAR